MEQLYPIGIETFEKIRTNGFVYIDKTDFIKRLVRVPGYYFLSRPRRFGKSLLLSTLESYFEGKRELFSGLHIDTDDVEWKRRPVVKLSLNAIDPKSENDLFELLNYTLLQNEEKYGIKRDINSLSQRLERLLRVAYEHTGEKTVVLVDEYDAPLLATLHKPELNASYRETLKSIFSVLKSADRYIHFAMLTGVSRFSHTSLFSGANNIEDITMDDSFGAICGITASEASSCLMPGIERYASQAGIALDEAVESLKENYDGYHFTKSCPDIYNPYSLFSALKRGELCDTWFQSGTPTFLVDTLRDSNFYIPGLDCIDTKVSSLSAIESYNNNPVALLFETGYLTIKGYDDESQIYTLELPNKEVSQGFANVLLPTFAHKDRETADSWMTKMQKD